MTMARIGCLLTLLLVTAASGAAPEIVRVGVFENKPIIFQNADGEWAGLAVDVLEATARQERWQLQYVRAPWRELLSRLERGELDLLLGIAYTADRAQRMRFTEHTLVSNWGIVYRAPGVDIGSLLDLRGRRVAMMNGSVHSRAFEKLMAEFQLEFEPVLEPSYGSVLSALQDGRAEAGVINRIFSIESGSTYRAYATPVVFNPVEVRYAAPQSAPPAVLDALDRQLARMKAGPGSVYHRSVERWLTGKAAGKIPEWLPWAAALVAGVVLLVLAMNVLLHRQVRARTRELVANTLRLQGEIEQRHEAQERLNHLAYYDNLTGLANRVLFRDRFQQALAQAQRDHRRMAVMLLDLDRFKDINESLGHPMGDRLIRVMAERFRRVMRDSDSIARFGGDEFTVLLTEVDTPEGMAPIAERLLRYCAEACQIGETDVYMSASIGIAIYPDDADDIDGLLKHADTAMYQAKRAGGHSYKFYSPEMTARAAQRVALEGRLRSALEREEFSLAYQPIADLRSGRLVAVEALLRWDCPEGNGVGPGEFIPVAEETGLIVPIGEWALEEACAQMRRWHLGGLTGLRVAVNVSSRQIGRARLVEAVLQALRRSGLEARFLELELTERVFVDNTDLVHSTLERLADLGVHISIDDFGTGYSSLGYLKRLPIKTIKIDRTFVAGVPDDGDDAELTSAIIAMAHGLGCRVVAEGIETSAQLSFLQRQGCDEAQGYMFAGPMQAERCEAWLRERRGTPLFPPLSDPRRSRMQ